jgi:cytochrome P450
MTTVSSGAVTDLESLVERYARQEPALMADRWPLYRQLREFSPFHRVGATTLVTRYHDIVRILSDDASFEAGPFAAGSDGFRDVPADLTSTERSLAGEIVDFQGHWMTARDGSRHDQLRRVGTRVFTVKAVFAMQQLVDDLVDELLTSLSDGAIDGEVEFITGFAYKLPLAVISRVLDMPAELSERLHNEWLVMVKFLGGLAWRRSLPQDLTTVHAAYHGMYVTMSEFLASKRQSTTSDILKRMFTAQIEDPSISEADLIGVLSQLFTAGHQTTQDLLGNGLYDLLSYPDQWAELCRNPALVPATIEEVLRFRAPAQDVDRTAVIDVDFGDYTVRAGDHLTLILGSANHDPEQFADPDRFDITRADTRGHVTFSRGPHLCLGAALSRMEGAAALKAMTRRFPHMQLRSPNPLWVRNTHLMGLQSLSIALGPEVRTL